jgi:periplasmic divalent cation tolerance protein
VTVLVFATASSRREAERLASAAVSSRLAACATVVPGVSSIYRWKGRVAKADECLLLFKTTRARLRDLSRTLVKLHSYDVPEVLAVNVDGGHAPYKAWIQDSVGRPRNPSRRSRT